MGADQTGAEDLKVCDLCSVRHLRNYTELDVDQWAEHLREKSSSGLVQASAVFPMLCEIRTLRAERDAALAHIELQAANNA
jgi:hypothetical protein